MNPGVSSSVLQVDAFTDEAFKGNPAAVCLLEEERDEEWLQAVAREFNLSETCYLTRLTDSPESTNDSANALPIPRFHLRWFTPVAEVKLCGHATLAASHVLFTYGLVNADVIEFSTLSGILTAKRIPDVKVSDSSNFQNGDASETWLIELDFPVVPIMEYDYAADVSAISKSLNGASVMEIKKTTTENELLVVLPSGNAVVEVEPQFDEIKNCPARGIIITGPAPAGSGYDFFSRFFCPKLGVDEDPVCGSAHCALVPYWSKRLGKCDFVAYQASPRSGVLNLHLDEETQRVLLRGKATLMMEGSVLV
ncbi:Phenazine biosynthesis PhzC/PhzF protein [Abeliophyllum distichum]|uniref:Phenazine biosynthesis PhzC/PhzF protein n=1 Tax=Abeliophyllum distichum TaxID=126358 RepID=A0ABD1NQM6_9LAMI